jgi:hypothetical protein
MPTVRRFDGTEVEQEPMVKLRMLHDHFDCNVGGPGGTGGKSLKGMEVEVPESDARRWVRVRAAAPVEEAKR